MIVSFNSSQDGKEIIQLESQDVSGILAAAKGEDVSIDSSLYKYQKHSFSLSKNQTGEQYYQHLVIFLEKIM